MAAYPPITFLGSTGMVTPNIDKRKKVTAADEREKSQQIKPIDSDHAYSQSQNRSQIPT
jgi:hypothetical protein